MAVVSAYKAWKALACSRIKPNPGPAFPERRQAIYQALTELVSHPITTNAEAAMVLDAALSRIDPPPLARKGLENVLRFLRSPRADGEKKST